jgi:protein involved in temperature-dependent protein secretion
VKLGRMTEWSELSEDLFVPSGLRLFLVDWQDKAILEMRSIEFDPVVAEQQLVSAANTRGDARN